VVIVLAGPAMNVVFPVALYTSVFLEDRTFPAPNVGVVTPGRTAEGKLVPGDRILSVDGKEVETFPDVQRIVAQRAGTPVRFLVERDGKQVDVQITPADELLEMSEVQRELDVVEHVARVGIMPNFPAPVVGIPRSDSPAYRSGLRTFDRITAINGRKVERFLDLIDMLAKNPGNTVVLGLFAAGSRFGGRWALRHRRDGSRRGHPHADAA